MNGEIRLIKDHTLTSHQRNRPCCTDAILHDKEIGACKEVRLYFRHKLPLSVI